VVDIQRDHRQAKVLGVRPLAEADLERLRRKAIGPKLAKLRDIHHIIADLVVMGLTQREVAEATGYSQSRLSLILTSPAMVDLLAEKRKDRAEAMVALRDERLGTMTRIQAKALRHVEESLDRAEEEGEPVPIQRALAVAADMSDRIGYVKKSVSVNVNVDFANRLEAARRRSAQARVIDAQVAPAA
jgi:transcriptional regulator with XRE-family HTH domain